ncbi:hypothetical protein [Verrucomicrobium spinosum]|nr:hypothetical protein [Verrucomicrobium spinosum]
MLRFASEVGEALAFSLVGVEVSAVRLGALDVVRWRSHVGRAV